MVLPTHVILRIKRNKPGQSKNFKAWVVAGGHKQVFPMDYVKIYDLVVDFIACLLILLVVYVRG